MRALAGIMHALLEATGEVPLCSAERGVSDSATGVIIHIMGPALNGQKSPCYTVLILHFFRKARPATNRESPEGRGTRALRLFLFRRLFLRVASALPFPFLGPDA
jgi:hypothetical protein